VGKKFFLIKIYQRELLKLNKEDTHLKKIISCYTPYVVNNLYATNVRWLLENQSIEALPIKKCLSNPLLFAKCKIYNFNWFEKVNSKKQFYLKCLLLDSLHFAGKKIIYTLHNKQPHNISDNDLSLKMMRKMCRRADAIVGLCPDTKDIVSSLDEAAVDKLKIVPHPNYIRNYDLSKTSNMRSKFGFLEDDMVFLFFGFVSPYKNIEMLIKTFNQIENPRIKLLIAGNPCDTAYKEQLLDLTEGILNIVCDFRYIADDEIVKYYNTADIVVLPYHKTSSLNSGAVYLSFSHKKTVICPDIGTIRALKDRSFVYDYTYLNESEHANQLNNVIMEACADYESDSSIFKVLGERAFKYIKEYHSDEIISEMYSKLYQSLL